MFFHNLVYLRCPYCRFCVEVDLKCYLCPMCGVSLSAPDNLKKDC